MPRARSARLCARELFGQGGRLRRIAVVAALWFGAGLSPAAPGTAGSLAAVPLVMLVHALGRIGEAVCAPLLIALAVWSAGIYQAACGRTDPGEVVIDEVAGFYLTLFWIPLSWQSLLLGFILFRLADILKPFPCRRMEALPGGMGIVLDDLAAGLYAHIGLRVLLRLAG